MLTKVGLLQILHDYIEGIRISYVNEYYKNRIELKSEDIIHNALIDCQTILINALEKI